MRKYLIASYTLQAIILNLFNSTIPLLLAQRQYSLYSLGIYSLVGYSFPLKIIFAPIVDIYHVKSIGRRRSYILPINIMICLFLVYMSQVDLFEDIFMTQIIAFISILIVGIQDLALDGLSADQSGSNPALAQNIGINLGTSINVLFVVLNSYEYMTISNYFKINATIWTIYSLILIFLMREPELHKNKKIADLKSMKIIISQIPKNKYFVKLIVLSFIERFPLCVLDACWRFKLVTAGVSAGAISLIDYCQMPVKLSAGIIFTKYYSKYNNYAYYGTINIMRLVENAIAVTTLVLLETHLMKGFMRYVVLYMAYSIWLVRFNITTIIRQNFYCSVTTPGFETTILTLMSSINTMSQKSCTSLGLFAADYFQQFYTLVAIGWISQLVFSTRAVKEYQYLATQSKDKWSLVGKSD